MSDSRLTTSGKPGNVGLNTNPGAQFTNAAFADKPEGADVRISTDCRGRWLVDVFVERLCSLKGAGPPEGQR